MTAFGPSSFAGVSIPVMRMTYRLNPGLTYQFGVSRYEIAGRSPDKRASQPNHGAGEIGEELILIYN